MARYIRPKMACLTPTRVFELRQKISLYTSAHLNHLNHDREAIADEIGFNTLGRRYRVHRSSDLSASCGRI
jgi:hypothetical protein